MRPSGLSRRPFGRTRRRAPPAGVGGIYSGALPKALCWPALVLGLLLLTPAGFIGFLLSPLWIIAVTCSSIAVRPAHDGVYAGWRRRLDASRRRHTSQP